MKSISILFKSSLLLAALLSFYLFSRFTVDDAFISWRYGKNLIEFGVWNYNPTTLDLTQAYTNPIYSLLSIIPSALELDVVLFFKLLSLLTILLFILWIYRKSNGATLLPLAFLSVPAVVVHAFGGLETFLFVVLTGWLLVSLYEEKWVSCTLISIALFFTRPESWLFVALTPTYFLFSEPSRASQFEFLKNPIAYTQKITVTPSRALKVFLVITPPLLAYFIFHKLHFDNFLPNTFYAKSGAQPSVSSFLLFGFFILPLTALLIINKVKLAVLSLAFFGAMVVSYSTSDLQMNYAGRFAFHIFAPIYIFYTVISGRVRGDLFFPNIIYFSKSWGVKHDNIISTLLLIYLASFFYISGNMSLSLATYYPRALLSHAELGKTLNQISKKYNIDAFSFGDAGMTAYHSRLSALDNIGLGSAIVAQKGLDSELMSHYGVDLVAFHANSEGIRLNSYNQDAIFSWAQSEKLLEICDVYWQKDYMIKIFARARIEEIEKLCVETRKTNSLSNRELFKAFLLPPPWLFWTE